MKEKITSGPVRLWPNDGVDHDPQNFFSNFGESEGLSFANRNYNSGGGGGGTTSSAGLNGVRKQRYSVPNYYQDTYQDTYRRDPYTEQTIQTYPADTGEYYTEPYSGGVGSSGVARLPAQCGPLRPTSGTRGIHRNGKTQRSSPPLAG